MQSNLETSKKGECTMSLLNTFQCQTVLVKVMLFFVSSLPLPLAPLLLSSQQTVYVTESQESSSRELSSEGYAEFYKLGKMSNCAYRSNHVVKNSKTGLKEYT